MGIDERAFLGKRVTVDGELLLAYASARGITPLEAGRMFGARLAAERDTCKMDWRDKMLGWHCSACGHIMRGYKDARPNFCIQCGAANIS